jgi:hypothetical protein
LHDIVSRAGPADLASSLGRVRRLADWLDTRFVVPGLGWRFGLDGLLGLVPGAGDTILSLISLYIVAEAWRLGVRKRTLARMIGNVLVDAGVGAIPVAGDVFDFLWKANRRNVALLEADLAAQQARARLSTSP